MIPPRVASALRRTARIAIERPRAALWTLLALTCALAAVGAAAIAATSLDRWVAARAGGHASASMVVYLGEGVTDAQAAALVGELRGLHGVERAELVPAAESARRLLDALGYDARPGAGASRDDSNAGLLEGVDPASLPASVEVVLAPGVRDVIAMSPTVRALRGAPGVAEVVVEDASDDHWVATLDTARTFAWAGAALFAGLALFVVLAAIRVRLDRGRQEIAVAQLLGAGPGFIVVPTALAGALSGFVAAALATLGLGVGLLVYGDAIGASVGDALVVPAASELVAFLAGGALLGLVGGGLAGASRVAR